MSGAAKNVLAQLTKDVERDLIDHSTGLIEDVGKTLRLILYKQRGIEAKQPDPKAAIEPSVPITRRSNHSASKETDSPTSSTEPTATQ